ncbi:hypothetical protein [Microcoleus sp. bin38.metabat.b11b12b14.051]|uniref:hypothetical protein n=1 Tax=Microcoleus sp. bin38.metabat.b11b12b14.051 TaxID=2742709 RepID=UPI0025D67777|nr:hypothetical protein [Microcoleus sp. bin38.metabat.b11b12b14.051]
MDITEWLTIGQAFSIDNPPNEILSEEWKVVGLSYPDVTFSYTTYWVRDIAYIHISTTDTVVGVAIEETDQGVIIELKNSPYLEVGLLIKGDKASYLIDELS